MNSPALTMASPAVELNRSRSSPDLFLDASPLTHDSLRLSSPKSDPGGPAPGFDLPSFDFGADVETNLPIAESLLPKVDVTPNDEPVKPAQQVTFRPPPEPMAVPRPAPTKRRSKSIVDRPRSWLTSKSPSSTGASETKEKAAVLKKTNKRADEKEPDAKEPEGKRGDQTPERRGLANRDRSASFRSSSFADFAKKSWISSSRSPSPIRERERRDTIKDQVQVDKTESPTKKDSSLLSPHKLTRRTLRAGSLGDNERSKSAESLSGTTRAFNRASVYLGKIKHPKPPPLPTTTTTTTTTTQELAKPIASLAVPQQAPAPKSESVSPAASTRAPSENVETRLSSQTNLSSTSDSSSGGTGSTGITEPSHAPDIMAAQKQPPPPPPRDPLFALYRRLDSEYAIFLTKTTTAQRILLARNVLTPFLRTHGPHAHSKDNANLTPEDIDRRATILHKWWNGLLELLEGTGLRGSGPAMTFAAIQANSAGLQPVSGVDRPSLLELITLIMMRPEWRMATASFRPLKDRTPQDFARSRAGTTDSADFIVESAEHNVRTMFVNNLLTQMGIVVDKMSSRHVPTSMVTFCGKACAYAFFFVPGIAEVLVRLWGLAPDQLRRVADEFGLPRRTKVDSDHIMSLFPPTLQRLGWTSVKTMTDNLRLTTKLSLVAAKIQWHGPWVSPWRGGDTDLFFIFCKYYYILTEDFMAADLPLSERAKAPGFALIHAQLLSVLDTTIHLRQAAMESLLTPHIPDSANGADAMAATFAPLPPSNLLKGMDENRLIVLLKDMLSDTSIGGLTTTARETFATSFMSILKAATKKTPVFKQPPVLVLTDFFTEVLLAFDAYTGYTDADNKDHQLRDHVDWSFWLDVFHKILFESNSTMSEIRILSLIFSTWDIITADEARKEKFCIGWLLSAPVFDKFFNNYTPMVRAYFMRLLCWRICRDQGNPTELDMRIFSLVSTRLKQAWSHYLWLKQAADATGKLPPSTAPCHPQPGKRFRIIRIETTPPQSGLLQTGFDTMTSAFSSPDTSTTTPAPVPTEQSSDSPPGPVETTAKKRWSIFGRMLSFSSGTSNAGGSSAAESSRRGSSANDDLESARRALAAERSGPAPPPKGSPSRESDASSTGSTPVYDAAQYVFKFALGVLPWIPNMDMNAATSMHSTLPRDRPLARPRLPGPAQARVSARNASIASRGDSPSPTSPETPPPGRIYLGNSQKGGLVSEARNASRLDTDSDLDSSSDRGLPANKNNNDDLVLSLPEIQRVTAIKESKDKDTEEDSPATMHSANEWLDMSVRMGRPAAQAHNERPFVPPVQPVGLFKERATYSGRALAEWAIVVNECNSFVDRRRDEGVCGLKDVEVPSLGVENLRRSG